MDQQVFSEYLRATKPTTQFEQLRIERDFRFFLIHLLDTAPENLELVNSISPLYQSELSRMKGKAQAVNDQEFRHILTLFLNGDEPVNIEIDTSMQERRNILLSFLPDNEFSDLKESISKMEIPFDLFQSMAHTFAFYSNLFQENKSLEKRIQTIRDVRHFNPESNNVFIPTRPQSSLSTPRSISNSKDLIYDSNQNYSATSTIRVHDQTPIKDQSSFSSRSITPRSVSSFHTNTSYWSERQSPRTPRVTRARTNSTKRSQAFMRFTANETRTAKCRMNSADDSSIIDMDNYTLRMQIESKEKQIKYAKNQSKQLQNAIEKRLRDVTYLEKEIIQLEQTLESLQKEEEGKQEEQVAIDEKTKQYIQQKKKEANDITIQLRIATEENRKLKELKEIKEREFAAMAEDS